MHLVCTLSIFRCQPTAEEGRARRIRGWGLRGLCLTPPPPHTQNKKKTNSWPLGSVLAERIFRGRFGYIYIYIYIYIFFFFFSARGGGRGESEALGGWGVDFLLKIPGGGVSPGKEGPRGRRVFAEFGNSGGGGAKYFFFGAEMSTKGSFVDFYF